MTHIVCTRCGCWTGECQCYMDMPPKETLKDIKREPMIGWICPVCGRGVSPFSRECTCGPHYKTETATTK